MHSTIECYLADIQAIMAGRVPSEVLNELLLECRGHLEGLAEQIRTETPAIVRPEAEAIRRFGSARSFAVKYFRESGKQPDPVWSWILYVVAALCPATLYLLPALLSELSGSPEPLDVVWPLVLLFVVCAVAARRSPILQVFGACLTGTLGGLVFAAFNYVDTGELDGHRIYYRKEAAIQIQGWHKEIADCKVRLQEAEACAEYFRDDRNASETHSIFGGPAGYRIVVGSVILGNYPLEPGKVYARWQNMGSWPDAKRTLDHTMDRYLQGLRTQLDGLTRTLSDLKAKEQRVGWAQIPGFLPGALTFFGVVCAIQLGILGFLAFVRALAGQLIFPRRGYA